MTLKLSVLDQSLARAPDQASVALQETLHMARWCEQLGYTRFWVSEHHAFPSVAGSAPEVLLAALGAAANSIRIGSVGLYKSHFQPSAQCAEPYAILTLSVFCADTEEQARALQLTYDLNLFRFFTGTSIGQSMTPQEALSYPLGPQERAFIASRENSRAAGTPQQVRQKLEQLAALHQADEIMAVTNMYYLDDRKRSFELLQQVFE